MPKISVHNLSGKKVGEIELSEAVFGASKNDVLLHQVYLAQSGNQRTVVAHAKGRAEVAGSGKKPWQQKGTGNARAGQKRSPIWRGGGAAFGPTKDRNFKKKINAKMRKKGVSIALSEKVRSKSLIVIDEIKLKEKKTKEFAKALHNLKIKGSVLLGLAKEEKEIYLYSRNIPRISPMPISSLNVFDILNNKHLVLSQDSVKFIEDKFKK